MARRIRLPMDTLCSQPFPFRLAGTDTQYCNSFSNWLDARAFSQPSKAIFRSLPQR
jgi:hypothetical protein